MQSKNGDVQLSVTLDTAGIASDAQKIKKEIEKEISETSTSIDVQKVKVEVDSNSLKSAEKSIDSLTSDTKNLGDELNKGVESLKNVASSGVYVNVDSSGVDTVESSLYQAATDAEQIAENLSGIHGGIEVDASGMENAAEGVSSAAKDFTASSETLSSSMGSFSAGAEIVSSSVGSFSGNVEEFGKHTSDFVDAVSRLNSETNTATDTPFTEHADEAEGLVQDIKDSMEELDDQTAITLDSLKQRWEDVYKSLDFANSKTTDDAQIQFNTKIAENQLQEIRNLVQRILSDKERTAFNVWVNDFEETREEAQKIVEVQQQLENKQKHLQSDTEGYAQALNDARNVASDLASDLFAFSQGFMYSEDFKKLQEASDVLTKNLDKVNLKLKEMEILGQADSEKYQELVKQAEQLKNNLNEVTGEMKLMRDDTSAYTLGSNPKEAAQVQKQYDTLTNKMSLMKVKMSDINKVASILPGRLGTAFNKISRTIQDTMRLSTVATQNATAGIAEAGAGATSAISGVAVAAGAAIALAVAAVGIIVKKISDTMKKVKEVLTKVASIASKGLQASLKGLAFSAELLWGAFFKFGKLLTGTLITGVQTLINKMLSLKGVVTENLKVMAQWRGGNNAVNTALSNLTSSLNYLKVALATAFAPILTVIEPILTRLIDKLAEAVTMVGMFIARLTGATSFQKAIKKQKDYAKSLSGVGSAAEEANEKLAQYDKLQVIQSDSKGGGGGAGSDFGVDFEEIKLDALDLQKFLDGMIKKFGEWGKKLGTMLRDMLTSIPWDTIKLIVNSVAKAIANFINNFVKVEGLATAVGHAFGELVNTLVGFLDTLITGIDWGAVGKFIGEALMESIRTIEWDKIGQLLADGFNALFHMLRVFFMTFDGLEFGKKLSEMLTTFTQGINWNDVQAAVDGMMRDFAGILSGVITPETFGEIGRTLGNTIQTIFSGLGTFVEEADWKTWGESIGTGIVELFNSVDWAEAGKAISDLATGLLDMLSTTLDTAFAEDKNGNIPFVDNIVSFLDNIDWSAIGQKAVAISEKLREVFELIWLELEKSGVIEEFITMIADFMLDMKKWEKVFKLFKARFSIGTLLKVAFPNVSEGLDAFGAIFDGIKKAIEEKDWLSLGTNILNGILTIFSMPGRLLLDAAKLLFDGIWDAICGVFGIASPAKEMESIGENIIKGILEGFGLVDFVASMTEWWDTNVAPWFTLERWSEIAQNVYDALSAKFTEVKDMLSLKWDEIKTNVSTKWEEIKLGISEKVDLIKQAVEEKITNMKTNVSEIFTGLKDKVIEIWTNLKTELAKPLNAILGAVESLVNGIIGGINRMIDALNGVGFDVPDWLPVVGGKKFSMNLTKLEEIQLPRLAQGAVIPPNREFMAVLGDQKSGTNIETPLNTMMDAFRQVLSEYGGSTSKEPIVLQLNGKTVAQVVWDEERKKYRQTASYSY